MNKTQNRFLKGWSIHCFGHSASITRFVVLTIALLTFEGGTYKASAKWDREAWPISIGLYTSSNHVLTHDVMQLATLAVSIPLTQLTGRGMSRDFALYNMHFMSLEDNGENIGFKTGHPFGFTSYDLFNSLEWGVKIGWRGSESPIGIYVTGGYALNQYKLRFLGEHEYSKHKLQSWRPGLILNLSSYRFFMDELEWGFAPFAEIGTTYVYNFKYKGPNDSNIDQINNGVRMNYAIGAYIEDFGAILVKFDMAQYDFFNKNYTPDGGFWYPYANFKNKDFNIFLGFRTTW